MEHLVSVIVPIYNVERFLERCFESIFNQTYKNF
jgi:glycosyltransferase involved in cell wall biosynthesis